MGMQSDENVPSTTTAIVLCRPDSNEHLKYLVDVAMRDANGLLAAHGHYGNSWKRRGGVSAFMMLARKWDRLEKFLEENGYDIFKAMYVDERPEGIIDDIRDLRRYLLLVESEAKANGIACAQTSHRDNLEETGKSVDRHKAMASQLMTGYSSGGENIQSLPKLVTGLEDRDPGPSGSVSDPRGER